MSESVTRSPIELFWTAKKLFVHHAALRSLTGERWTAEECGLSSLVIPVGGIGTVAVVMGEARLGTFGLLTKCNAHLEIPAKLELIDDRQKNLYLLQPPGPRTGYRLVVENLSSSTSWQVNGRFFFLSSIVRFVLETINCP